MASVSLMQFLSDYLTATLTWAVVGLSLVAAGALAWRACELLLMRVAGDRGDRSASAPPTSADQGQMAPTTRKVFP